MDQIFIAGLHIKTIIGVYDFERKNEQTLILDLNFDYDLQSAGISDNLADTLDYAAVAAYAQNFAAKNNFNLVEAFAEQLAQDLLHKFKLTKITLKVSKPQAIKNAQNVGVKITRYK